MAVRRYGVDVTGGDAPRQDKETSIPVNEKGKRTEILK